MSAARHAEVVAPREVALRDDTVPEPADDGVVVRVSLCGICGTDTHAYSSGGLIPPAVFGHEWTGVVESVGAAVQGLAVGQRVVAAVGAPCGTCAMCRAGHAETCDTAFAEANGVTDDAPSHGGFATHLAVSARRVTPTLDSLTDEQAALVEPTAVTFHAVRRTAATLGAVVVVQGLGPIGLLTAQHARHAGAGALVLVETSEERRQVARDLGFEHVFAPGDQLQEHLDAVSDGRGADVLYECTGVASLFQSSAEMVRRGGTLSLLGYPMSTSEVSYGDWQSRELRVVASLAYTHADFLGAMRSIADGSVDVDVLHTGTVGLDELGDMLAELDGGRTSHAKVLIDPRR